MLQLENIDRAIEWALRDKFIAMGLWPNERAYLLANDIAGLNAAINAMKPRVDVFGVGNFTDRVQLKSNNVIINRMPTSEGLIGVSYPYVLELQEDNTYSKFELPQGTVSLVYRITFVCYDVAMDRKINSAIQNVFGKRKFVYGMDDDRVNIKNLAEGFYIFKQGDPVDISGKDFTERMYTFIVQDAAVGEKILIEAGIPAATEVSPVINPNDIGADVLYPDDENDISFNSVTVVDYFLSIVEALPAWNKFVMARMYAQETEALAIKNLIHGPDALNSGLTFTPYKGFFRDVDNEYLDTKFSPSVDITLTSFCYMVFVTTPPTSGFLMDLFGLIDNAQNTSFFVNGQIAPGGTHAKGNSNTLLNDSAVPIKANTLYTLNRRNRFVMEFYEGDQIIMRSQTEPTLIPNGTVFDLGMSDENGDLIHSGSVGGLAFSAAGPGLTGSEIKQMNIAIRNYLTRIGLLTS